jgi:hypothetical protein
MKDSNGRNQFESDKKKKKNKKKNETAKGGWAEEEGSE